MIDYHSHILPGLDDGASDMDEAAAMARILSDAGFTAVCCTPHRIRGCYDADNESVVKCKMSLQNRLDNLGIRLQVVAGSEYYLDEFLMTGLDKCIPHCETPHVLVEFSNHMPEEFIVKSCYHMRSHGFIPVIAHPERCRLLDLPKQGKRGYMEKFLICDPQVINSKFKTQNSKFPQTLNETSDTLLEYLVNIGCQFQGNIGSFAGIYGEKVRGRAVAFLREGLYTRLGTDAHSPKGLAEWLDRGLREIEWDVGMEGVSELLGGLTAKKRAVKPGSRDWGLGAEKRDLRTGV